MLVNDLDKESMFWVGAMFSYMLAWWFSTIDWFAWGFILIAVGSLVDLFIVPAIKDRRKKNE
jgi:membrane protein YdbS with pleckstrin-like domain